jgi:hypothetical protein
MADVEVHIDLDGTQRPVGLLRRHASCREETVMFEYDETWLADDERFSIEPALALIWRRLPAAARSTHLWFDWRFGAGYLGGDASCSVRSVDKPNGKGGVSGRWVNWIICWP